MKVAILMVTFARDLEFARYAFAGVAPTAATQIGRRAGGSPNGDALAIFNAKIKSDENDAWRYFAGLPEGDKARIQASFT